MPLLRLGFPDLLHNDANHMLLEVLLVLLKRAFALFEALCPLLVLLFDASDSVVLALHSRICLFEVGFGLIKLLAKLLDCDLRRVISGGRRWFGNYEVKCQQRNNKAKQIGWPVSDIWIITYQLLRLHHRPPVELRERAFAAACRHRHCVQICRHPSGSSQLLHWPL